MFKGLKKLFKKCDHRFLECTSGTIVYPDWTIWNYEECVDCGKRITQRKKFIGATGTKK